MNRIVPIGEHGSSLIANTDTVTGAWHLIQVLSDTVFSVLDDPTMDVYGTLGSVTWKAGTLIAGAFEEIKLASGAVLAYRTYDV